MTTAAPPIFRPLTLAQILDQAIRLYRNNFLRFVGIMAVVQLPVTLFQIIASTFTTNSLFDYIAEASAPPDQEFIGAYLLGMGATLLATFASFILVQVVGNAALTQAVADSRTGIQTGVFEAFSKTGKTWPRLLGAFLLVGLLSILALVWWIVPCIGWLTGGGILAFLGMVITPMVAPVIILEKAGPRVSVQRAWDLARRRFWWVLGFMFILYLFNQLVVSGPAALVSLIASLALEGYDNPGSMMMINAITQALVSLTLSLIYLPLQTSAVTLAYLDLRVRTEGLDLAMQSALASAQPGDAPVQIADLPAPLPPNEINQIFESKDLANFALITIAFVGLYMLIFGGVFILAMALAAASGAGGL
jgi:hypothetical protein